MAISSTLLPIGVGSISPLHIDKVENTFSPSVHKVTVHSQKKVRGLILQSMLSSACWGMGVSIVTSGNYSTGIRKSQFLFLSFVP